LISLHGYPSVNQLDQPLLVYLVDYEVLVMFEEELLLALEMFVCMLVEISMKLMTNSLLVVLEQAHF